jgi:hypothetical protein
MHPTERTIFVKLQLVRSISLILGRCIITTLAFATCKSDDVSHYGRAPLKKEPGSPSEEKKSRVRITIKVILFHDFADNTGTYRTTALTNGKPQADIHGDRGNKLCTYGNIVARHYHFHPVRQGYYTGNIRGPEVKLGTIAVEKRSMTATLVFAKNIALGFEVGMRGDGTRLGQNLSALNLITLHTAKQSADIVAGLAFIEKLSEHLNSGTGGFLGRPDTYDLDFLTNLDDPSLHTTGGNRSTSGN